MPKPSRRPEKMRRSISSTMRRRWLKSRIKRIARSQAFARRILPLYDFRCVVCGQAHGDGKSVGGGSRAHRPRGLKGADDARNGLALCRSHHWAFDRGLFGVKPDRSIIIRPKTAADPRNAHLLPFDGKPIASPSDPALLPALDALAWHLKNVCASGLALNVLLRRKHVNPVLPARPVNQKGRVRDTLPTDSAARPARPG